MQFPLHALDRELVTVAGSFAPNGSSAIASSSLEGVGFTVARTSTGLFTITFADAFPSLVATVPGLRLASAADLDLQFGTYNSSAKTLQIRVWDYSEEAVADIAANANNRISFICVFKRVS